MISITKTAYPRFKKNYTEEELTKIFEPNEHELRFCRKNARGDTQRFTLLTLLKSHQYLGYIPNTAIVPKLLRQYFSIQLGFSKDLALIELTDSNKKTFYRYRKAIRSFLQVLTKISPFLAYNIPLKRNNSNSESLTLYCASTKRFKAVS